MTQTNILLESGTNEIEVVEFYLDEPGYRGHYGINVAKVVEIIRPQKVTSTPQRPHPCVLGAFTYRDGRVVPMVDLNIYLENPPVHKLEHKVIITEFNKVITAFQVSGVNRIYRMSWKDVEAPGKFLQESSKNTIVGVVRLDGRVVFLLDLEGIVGDLNPKMALSMRINSVTEDKNGKVRILHADDSGSIRQLIHKLLSESGHFEVIQVSDGQEAFDLIKSLNAEAISKGLKITDMLDGLIADIEMPRLDGLTLCRKIKEDHELKQLPVAIFSSLVTDALRHKGDAVGADVQFAKPDLQNLSSQLFALIQEKKAERENG